MKAMIFAAGEGRRMRPLTLATPKPLLRVGDLSLLEHLVKRLSQAGVTEVVINVSYLADQIICAIEKMDLAGMSCHLSVEESPLETGGGLKRALPYLGQSPFLLVNSDVWCDIDFNMLINHTLPKPVLAHLMLVESPEYNHNGDFVIENGSMVRPRSDQDTPNNCLTFAGVSLVHPELIRRYADDREVFPLRDLLWIAMQDHAVTGEYHPGFWSDIGTPERLDALRERYEHSP